MKILITGFEPFSDFKVNPSETLVRALSDWVVKNTSHQVETFILPVEYIKTERWIGESDFSRYDFVFQFGVAANRSKVGLERVALNWMESKVADNSGILKQGVRIHPAQPEAFYSGLDLSKIVQELEPLFDNNVEVSFSAGAYLCNYSYFLMRAVTPNTLFVHIPSQLKVGTRIYGYTEETYSRTVLEISVALLNQIFDRKK